MGLLSLAERLRVEDCFGTRVERPSGESSQTSGSTFQRKNEEQTHQQMTRDEGDERFAHLEPSKPLRFRPPTRR
jgi:hypothetical protein